MGGGGDGEMTAETVLETPRAVRRPARDIADQTRLGHFHLLEPLGQGGMGTVFSAYDLHLDRKVAIKLLSERDMSPQQDHRRQQRLLREAQAMAKLSHPNVVPVYEVGIEDDTVFIAMEYVEGETLGDWLKAETRHWREIIEVFVRAARGLAAAHEAGIVHRDFKPSNVLVGVRGRVRVVDFGIARVSEDDTEPGEATDPAEMFEFADGDDLTPLTPSGSLTVAGSLVGTPAYMSPEQYESAAVDASSDQFSFCVALYHALFGKRPFAGRGDALAENVKAGRLEKPSSKTVPSWVTAIVLRGLETEPTDRFASMSELAGMLSRNPRRSRVRTGLAVLGVLAVAGTGIGWWQLGSRADDVCAGLDSHFDGVWDSERRAAVASSFAATGVEYADASLARVTSVLDDYRGKWITMRTEACKATHVTRERSERVLDLRNACLDQRLSEVQSLTALMTGTIETDIAKNAVKAVTALTPLGMCADTAALLQPGLEPTDELARAKREELLASHERLVALRRVGRGDEALEPARALVADARSASDRLMLARGLTLQGALESHAGDLAAAEATLAQAIRAALQVGDTDLLARAAIALIYTLAEGGIVKSREALGVIGFVEAFIEDTHDPLLAIRLATEKGNEYMVVARPKTARPILEETLVRAREELGDEHPQVFHIRGLYASALGRLKEFDHARSQYEALIAGATKTFGALHPTTLMARVSSCRVLVESGSVEGGATCYAGVIPDAVRVIGRHNRQLLSYRSQYALALDRLDKREDARRIYAEALADIPEAAWSERWFVAADIARALGWIEVELGEHAAALGHCERAVATTNPKHRGPYGVTCVGEALLGLGDAARALEVLEPMAERVANTKPAHLGASTMQVGMWRFAYARALWAVHGQAAKTRVIAATAREELGDNPLRDKLDTWLATVPRR